MNMTESMELNIDYLRQFVTGHELAAARSVLAKMMAQMNAGEKRAFLAGFQMATSAYVQSENMESACRLIAPVMIAIHELTVE